MNFKSFAFRCLLPLALVSQQAEANPIFNGDFSLGNTGFSSQYGFSTGTNTSAGVYAVATNPQLLHPDAASFGDHTTGTGNMLIANGATSPNTTVWEQTVSVSANTNYLLSGWAASWGNYGDGIDTNPARLLLFANGLQLGGESIVSGTNGLWNEFQYSLNSSALTSITFRIVDANIVSAPNDFSLDDISLEVAPVGGTVPEPATYALTAIALIGLVVCWKRQQASA